MKRLMGAEERGQLIPGLPEELVLTHVVPRLPWYTRPLCRALSKSWRALLDTRNPDLDLRTRTMQLPALRGLFLFCTWDKHVFIRDPDVHDPWQARTYKIQRHWRKLPPLNGSVVPLSSWANIIAVSGMVYVWPYSHPAGVNFVLKLDMGCAEWTWKKLPVLAPFNAHTISFNGKIYVPLTPMKRFICFTDSSHQKYGVFVHDVVTDECKPVETWNQSGFYRVLSECGQSNGRGEVMYCLLKHAFDRKLEALMYDAESDSWRTQESLPFPSMPWPDPVRFILLNSDCFEPAPERGVNIIWVDYDRKSMFWFNSSLGEAWVEISYDPVMKGRYLHSLEFIRGSMYYIFRGEQEGEGAAWEDEGGGGILTIRKGRVIVADKIVVWEEVHEVGLFHRYGPLKYQPIDWYTVMV